MGGCGAGRGHSRHAGSVVTNCLLDTVLKSINRYVCIAADSKNSWTPLEAKSNQCKVQAVHQVVFRAAAGGGVDSEDMGTEQLCTVDSR